MHYHLFCNFFLNRFKNFKSRKSHVWYFFFLKRLWFPSAKHVWRLEPTHLVVLTDPEFQNLKVNHYNWPITSPGQNCTIYIAYICPCNVYWYLNIFITETSDALRNADKNMKRRYFWMIHFRINSLVNLKN